MQSIICIETYAYRTWKHLLSEKGDINFNNIIKPYKKKNNNKKNNFDDVTKESIKEHNPN